MTISLGFLGTGTITAAIVRGLKASALRDWPVMLSPPARRFRPNSLHPSPA